MSFLFRLPRVRPRREPLHMHKQKHAMTKFLWVQEKVLHRLWKLLDTSRPWALLSGLSGVALAGGLEELSSREFEFARKTRQQ
eukprot:8479-Pyramimonas_sp.AAC.1